MVQVAKLTADLTANTSRFEEGMRRANRSIKDSQNQWAGALKKGEKSFDNLYSKISRFGAGLAAGLSLGKFLSDLRGVVNRLDDVGKASQRLGATTEAISRLDYAAKLADVSFEKLEASLRFMQRSLGEVAGGGGKKAAKALEDLGLSVQDLIDLQPDEALARIADGFTQIESPILRTQTAIALFGKSGAGMLNLLKDGSAGLKELYTEAQNAGVVIDQELAAKAEKLNDDLTRLNESYQGFLINLADTGAIEGTSEAINELGYGINNLGERLKDVGAYFTIMFDQAKGLAKLSQHELEREYSNVRFSNTDYANKVKGEIDTRAQKKVDAKEGLNNLAKVMFGVDDIDKASADLKKTIGDKYQQYFSSPAKKPTKLSDFKSSGGSQKTDSYTTIVRDLENESEQLRLQIELYGDKSGALERAKKNLEINNQLTREGISLLPEQREQLDQYLDHIQQQSVAYEQLQEQEKARQKELERQQRMLDDLGNSFESAFEDAIVEGEKLSDVLNALLQDILRIVIRTQVVQPLVSGLGSLFEGIIPSFAVGTNNVPHDMTANIHKGEMIIPADEAARLRKGEGGSGGGGVNVNIINNANAKVSTSSSKNGNGTDLNIMLDQAIADKISQPGSKTNQALIAARNRSLTRR